MSQTTTTERPRVYDPFGGMEELGRQTHAGGMASLAPAPGSAVDQAEARIVTAQRVAVKRDIHAVYRDVEQLAHAAGDAMYYSWEVEDRQNKRKTRVEGPSIDCAMMLVNAYGNCSIEAFPAKESATHYTFLARFIDYEKGTTVTRSFQQRKGQNIGGRMDAGRAEDMIFQIGQSKAMRNSVVGALKVLAEYAVEVAKRGVLKRINDNPEGARAYLATFFREKGIELLRVERALGRPIDRWAARDMAQLYAEIQAVKDGHTFADDLWPTAEAEALKREESVRADAEFLRGQEGQPSQPQARPQADQQGPAGPTPPPAEDDGRGIKPKPAARPRAAKPPPADSLPLHEAPAAAAQMPPAPDEPEVEFA